MPNFYGSFGVSVLGSQRAAITSVVAPWANFLSYGPITAEGTVEAIFSFDHRGMAGAQPVQALEPMLHGQVLAKLQACAAPG